MAFKFTRLSIYPSLLDSKYHVEWDGQGMGNFSFTVELSPTDSGPWVKAADVFGDNEITITKPDRILSNIDALWFRVIAKENGVQVAVSSPDNAAGEPTRPDYLRYREMLRRWNLELKKFNGATGTLLRLKTFGEPASNVHPILGQPIGTEDKDGLGQKFKGGYWPPIDMFVAYEYVPPGGTSKIPVEEQGLVEQADSAFLAMPYPTIKPQDIWISKDANARYKVAQVDQIEFRGLKVKQSVKITRLPVTDPAFKIPLR